MAMTEREKQEKISEYNKKYYRKKKLALKKSRHDKYHQDPTYRKQVIKRSRSYYNKYKKSPSPSRGYTIKKFDGIELYTIKYLAEVLQYSESSIRKFEAEGILPKSIYTDRRSWRYYSSDQIELCVKAFGERRAGRWTNVEVSKFLNNFWVPIEE